MKQVQLTLETAKEFYKQGGAGKKFALDNYSEKELTRERYPKKWEDAIEIGGYKYFINGPSEVKGVETYNSSSMNKNLFPSKELAEANLALSQLLVLRDVYNEGRSDSLIFHAKNTIYCLFLYNGEWLKTRTSIRNQTFKFISAEARDTFYDNFKHTLLEQVKPLFT